MPYLKAGDAVTFYEDPLTETEVRGQGFLIEFVSSDGTLETWIADRLVLGEGEGESPEPSFITETWQFKALETTPVEEIERKITTEVPNPVAPQMRDSLALSNYIDEKISDALNP